MTEEGRFWFAMEHDDHVYIFQLLDGRRITGQVHHCTWLTTGEIAVAHIQEGASPSKLTNVPWHAVMTFERLVQ